MSTAARPSRVQRRGAQRVAGERGDRGRLGALAADVADHQRPVAAAGREAVVEVAADLVAVAGGEVARGELDARDRGQLAAGAASAAACGRSGRAPRTAARCRARARRAGRGPRTARGRPPSASRVEARRQRRPRTRPRAISGTIDARRPGAAVRWPLASRRRSGRAGSALEPRQQLGAAARARARPRRPPCTLVVVSPSRITHVSASSRTHSRATLSIVARSSSDWSNSSLASASSAVRASSRSRSASARRRSVTSRTTTTIWRRSSTSSRTPPTSRSTSSPSRRRSVSGSAGVDEALVEPRGGAPADLLVARTRRPGRARSPSRPAPGTCSR